MSAFAIGVDLGGTNLRIAAIDESGSLLEKITMRTRVEDGPAVVIDRMSASIQQLAAKYSPGARLLGAGVGIPGIIELRTGTLRESPNLPGWHDYPVRDAIERRLGAPVILENDANAAAFGETWLGAARDSGSMTMITLGTGVGGGIVINGRIWHGMTGMAGELGHITVDPNGPRCGCGNIGCAEQYASASAIMRMAREKIEGGHAAELARFASSPDAEFNAKLVHNLAVQGDRPAREIFQVVGWALGILVADLINALNLPMYVIGGGVSASWEMFSPAMFRELRKRSLIYTATAPADTRDVEAGDLASPPEALAGHTIVTRAVLGSDAGLYGAARLPMVAHERETHMHSPKA
ncbi:MAG: ROK family protein [Candidatus Korobacteraceae bacterium]